MFTPGDVIGEFTTKKGKHIVFRFPREDDLESLLAFINDLAREDTFISSITQEITLEEEKKYLSDLLQKMISQDNAVILGFDGEVLIANASVTRQTRRSLHVGSIGISIKSEYREEGIGSEMFRLLEELASHMKLRMLELTVFANNQRAIHVYLHHGFEEVGRIPEKLLYQGEYIDEVVMVKKLHVES